MVSVIIPFFNSESTLARAIDSVIKCNYVSEIILINDGSTDNSAFIAQEYLNKSSIIKFLYHLNYANKGASASRNLGLKYCSNDWIQFLDSDDELLPMKIESQLKLINKTVPFIVGNAYDVYPNGEFHKRIAKKDLWIGLICGKFGITSSNLWNRNFLLEIDGWDESLSSSQEYDLMFRILRINQNIKFTSDFSTIIHKTQNSISTSPHLKNQRVTNWLNLRLKIKEFLISSKLFSISRKYYYYSYLRVFCNEYGVKDIEKDGLFYWYCYSSILWIKKKLYAIKTKQI
jgi:glycosyltransferase involved in cell wall biosynthesis